MRATLLFSHDLRTLRLAAQPAFPIGRSESLVCVEAKTGQRVWHFQVVHHGLWDYDFAAMPVLGNITVDGREIEAVMLVSKQAFTYVFDRRTGEPVWPIEERPTHPSTVPREGASPTQPIPTKPPPFDLQGATVENLIDFTPELRSRATEQLQVFVHGPLYTPPSLKGRSVSRGPEGEPTGAARGSTPRRASCMCRPERPRRFSASARTVLRRTASAA